MHPNQTSGTRPLLIVDDDATFVRVLTRALTSRGFEVITASHADEARALARRHQPRHCVLDLKLGEENGLRLIPELHELVPDMRMLLLTGYASIATAVEAIKRGAHDYLSKPVDADAVVRALLDGDSRNKATKTCWTRRKHHSRCADWSGNTSSACSPNAMAIFRKQRVGWACIAAPCNAS